jgi:diaminopimelate decarboxylase
MIDKNTLEKFRDIPTPFYYYDLDVLEATLDIVKKETKQSGFKVHYAVKANHNSRILKIISSYGLGADCVSWAARAIRQRRRVLPLLVGRRRGGGDSECSCR